MAALGARRSPAVAELLRLVGDGDMVLAADVVAQLGPVVGPGPLDPSTAATQRVAWQYAQAWLEARQEELAQVAEGLRAVEEIPALEEADTAPVLADAAEVGAVVEAASGGSSAAAGLRALAAAVDGPESLLAASRRLTRLARFLQDDLRRVDEAAAYLTHPDLQVPDDHTALLTLHTSGAPCARTGAPGDR